MNKDLIRATAIFAVLMADLVGGKLVLTSILYPGGGLSEARIPMALEVCFGLGVITALGIGLVMKWGRGKNVSAK